MRCNCVHKSKRRVRLPWSDPLVPAKSYVLSAIGRQRRTCRGEPAGCRLARPLHTSHHDDTGVRRVLAPIRNVPPVGLLHQPHLLLLLLVAATVGCQGSVELPVYSGPPFGDVATEGEIAERSGCIVLQTRDNSTFVLVWPAGFTADASPLVIRDPQRRRVAGLGDSVTLGGVPGDSIRVPQCPGLAAWFVADVTTVNGVPVDVGPTLAPGPPTHQNPPPRPH